MDLADKEYVQRCCDGHPEDFRMLVDRYQALLLSYLASQMRGCAQVEETAYPSFQQTMLQIFFAPSQLAAIGDAAGSL